VPTVDPQNEERAEESVVRKALIRFMALAMIALLVVVIGTVLVTAQLAKQQALREARSRADDLANTVAAPKVNAAVRAGDPLAMQKLTNALQPWVDDASIRHVKLWTRDGRVLWSDEKPIVGKSYQLKSDVVPLFGTHKITAELAAPDAAENVHERKEGKSLEVYVGTQDAEGQPLVFEAYLPIADMKASERAMVMALLPLSLGAVLVLLASLLPLAVSLARRVERHQAERSKLMRHALLASDLERRRIAQDLHDGVIQDLAGLAYVLPTVERELASSGCSGGGQETIARASTILSRDVSSLRSLLTDLYPPNLSGSGLVGSLNDLARGTEGNSQLRVGVEVDEGLDLPIDAARLSYRVAREGLRNVVKHSKAEHADVRLGCEGHDVVVSVADDGVGVDDQTAPEEGHVGLRLLGDTVRDFGGHLDLRPRAEGGAILEARFRADLVPG